MSTRWLIATDEAGYGPTLGPLVVTASCWRLPQTNGSDSPARSLEALFRPFTRGIHVRDFGRVILADSKQLYRRSQNEGLDRLAAGIAAVLAAADRDPLDDHDLIAEIADHDWHHLCQQAWYVERLEGLRQPLLKESLHAAVCKAAGRWWRRPSLPCLQQLLARVIEPREFNDGCRRSGNKASLLSESALGLVGRAIRSLPAGSAKVFCDKHGGRNRYAALLLHEFPDARLGILRESREDSTYRLEIDGRAVEICFQPRADAFPPVAFSSMVAKYVRERLMDRFNHYWQQFDPNLRPTAGYTVDAHRFLEQIECLLPTAGIDREALVRSR